MVDGNQSFKKLSTFTDGLAKIAGRDADTVYKIRYTLNVLPSMLEDAT
jgi:hypothetical protein